MKRRRRSSKKQMAAPLSRLEGLGALHLEEETAQKTACGEGQSYCRSGLDNGYQTVLSADPCAIQSDANLNIRTNDYVMYVPNYRKSKCESSGFAQCGGPQGNRMGPKTLLRESILQGRSQILGPKQCPASQIKYLPQNTNIFPPDTKPTKCHDQFLFPRQTRVKRSCGSVSEVDMTSRLDPLPGVYQNAWVPFVGSGGKPAPTINSRRQPTVPAAGTRSYGSVGVGRAHGITATSRRTEGHRLDSNDKYPSWSSLKQQREMMMQEQ
jgi:hypothetical protein